VHGTVYGVEPGNAYTVWWIIDGEVFILVTATGGIANAKGELSFAAALPTGVHT
jgi:hypothetical protein